MMQIDTSEVPWYRDKTVILEFEHSKGPLRGECTRTTVARLVEVQRDRPEMAVVNGWSETAGWWRRKIGSAYAVCKPSDQFCQETGRRRALRTLHRHAVTDEPQFKALVDATLQQYFATRSQRPAPVPAPVSDIEREAQYLEAAGIAPLQ